MLHQHLVKSQKLTRLVNQADLRRCLELAKMPSLLEAVSTPDGLCPGQVRALVLDWQKSKIATKEFVCQGDPPPTTLFWSNAVGSSHRCEQFCGPGPANRQLTSIMKYFFMTLVIFLLVYHT